VSQPARVFNVSRIRKGRSALPAGRLLSFLVAADVALLIANFSPMPVRQPGHAYDNSADERKKLWKVKRTQGFHVLPLSR
jgi:hypothetical protein